jgi:PRC-barrel domain protein
MRPPLFIAVPAFALAGVAGSFAQSASDTISVDGADRLSTNVVGLEVYDGQKNDVGKIQDIVWSDGKTLKGYILSVGGFLGLGTHYVAVDPAVVAVVYDADNKKWRATTTVTKDELKAAPEFKYEGQWDAGKS